MNQHGNEKTFVFFSPRVYLRISSMITEWILMTECCVIISSPKHVTFHRKAVAATSSGLISFVFLRSHSNILSIVRNKIVSHFFRIYLTHTRIRMRVKIPNSKMSEWLTFRIRKLMSGNFYFKVNCNFNV